MDLEVIILNKTSKAEKNKQCMISFICRIEKIDLTEIDSIMMIIRGQGNREKSEIGQDWLAKTILQVAKSKKFQGSTAKQRDAR